MTVLYHFIPPDGEFELMSYRLSTPVKPLIWVEAAVESHKGRPRRVHGQGQGAVQAPQHREQRRDLRAGARRRRQPQVPRVNGQRAVRARQVCVRVEDQTAGWEPGVPHARTLWSPQCEKWYVCLPPANRSMLTIYTEQDFEKRAPITVKFEIPYFTVSGIQVRYPQNRRKERVPRPCRGCGTSPKTGTIIGQI